jgi:hypothetical protein
MPGIGRADIVCFETNEMWEIKYGGTGDEGLLKGISNADEQLNRYLDKGCTLQKGSSGKFHGSFAITLDELYYLVTYTTPELGVIVYTFVRTEKRTASVQFAYAPYTLYNEQKEGMLVGIMACALISSMGGIAVNRDYICYGE